MASVLEKKLGFQWWVKHLGDHWPLWEPQWWDSHLQAFLLDFLLGHQWEAWWDCWWGFQWEMLLAFQ